jgi:hypothetical protein
LVDKCNSCSVSSNVSSCSGCHLGYLLVNITCVDCGTITSVFPCNSCDASFCYGCHYPWSYLYSGGTCIHCSTLVVANCSTCDFNTLTCVTCIQTYYLENNTCFACASKFTDCHLCNVTDCIQCVPHYMVVNSTCTLCNTTISDCDLCD